MVFTFLILLIFVGLEKLDKNKDLGFMGTAID